MPLPQLNCAGELPAGVHQATMEEVMAQFGSGRCNDKLSTARLRRIFSSPGYAQTGTPHFLWSYITAKPDPNDVDVVLVMRDDFDVPACEGESRPLFDHLRAAEAFGASVFWIRPTLRALEPLEEFIAHWQITRDQTRRGIVEVRVMIHNDQELQATQERIAYFHTSSLPSYG